MVFRRLLPFACAFLCVAGMSSSAGAATRLAPAAAPTAAQRAATLYQATGLTPSQVIDTSACPAPTAERAGCEAQVLRLRSTHALVRPRVHPAAATAAVATPAAAGQTPPQPGTAGTPAWLQRAYDLTWLSANRGNTDTIAIVDAYDDPTAESDLATFRSNYNLPPCTTANGCFTEVNQAGQSGQPPSSPPSGSGWNTEESLDLDAVSALCPNCRIVFVEANSDDSQDLLAAQQTAHTLGANQISDSWGLLASQPVSGRFAFTGVATIASTGDQGTYANGEGLYPAAEPGVTAVGGTTLTAAATPRGFAEAAWSDSGSGCVTAETKPTYQQDPACPGRAVADVSADADPNTGLQVYSTTDGGWIQVGGTSLAAPLTAAFEAVTGTGPSPQWAYTDARLINDPITGSSGSCTVLYMCTATTGYDGPTGEGSISGQVQTGAPGIGGPTVNAGAGYAQAVNSTSASLAGGVYPNGLDTTYYWQYGTTNQQTATVDAGSGSGLVAATGTLTGLTPGVTYDYQLVAHNADGTTESDVYTFTTPTSDSAPQNTTAPAIAGTATQGQTLVASPGNWDPSGTFAYEWLRSADSGITWTPITGATDASYELQAADVGDEIEVTVTATNPAGSVSATSAPSGTVASAVPQNTNAPVIHGTVLQGRALTADPGTWQAWDTPTFSYQWLRCDSSGTTCSAIPGATSTSYTPGAADLNEDVTVTVTAADAFGSSQPAQAQSVGPVAGVPTVQSPPTITGIAAREDTLQVSTGLWWPRATSYAYQWQSSTDGGVTWSAIPGATQSSYVPTQADEGTELQVLVTATNAYGAATPVATAAVGPVAPSPPVNLLQPGVTGGVTVGQPLNGTPGTWRHSGSIAYQWQRNAGSGWSDIAGATSSSYTLTSTDAGTQIRLMVSETNVDGTVTAASNSVRVPVDPVSVPPPITTPVPPVQLPGPVSPGPPVVIRAPNLTGAARVGRIVRLHEGRYANATSVWIRFERCASSCVPQATRWGEMRLTAADAGAYLVAQVMAIGPGGRTVTTTNAIGPVVSRSVAATQLRPGWRTRVRAGGQTVNVSVTPLVAHISSGRSRTAAVTIAVTRPAHRRGRVRVWACAMGRSLVCTAPRTVSARITLTLSPPPGARVELIAAR